VERLYTGHCTGMVGYELIKKYKGENVEYIFTGKEIVM
jgi:metal-dependent hydrolase (beta-lactamase superfamily II)